MSRVKNTIDNLKQGKISMDTAKKTIASNQDQNYTSFIRILIKELRVDNPRMFYRLIKSILETSQRQPPVNHLTVNGVVITDRIQVRRILAQELEK